MRVLMVLGSTLFLCVSAGRAADEDQAAVHKNAEKYLAALLQRDKVTLQSLLHKRYEGRSLPGLAGMASWDKVQAIAHWTDPNTTFTRLTGKIESVRLFGDTAIETGTLSANRKEYGGDSTWADLGYTRVWVKEGKVWRLVHEQF